jgi:hypothetical protein
MITNFTDLRHELQRHRLSERARRMKSGKQEGSSSMIASDGMTTRDKIEEIAMNSGACDC